MPSRCCEFVDSRLRRFPPDRASAVPMDKPGKTQGVSPTLPTGRRLPNKRHSTPQQHGMILISGNGEISSRLHAFSLFLPESCPNNRDHRSSGLSLRELSTSPALLISLSVSPQPSSPAAFPDTLCHQAPGRMAFAALLVLFGRPTTPRTLLPISLALIGSLPSVPPEDPESPPGARSDLPYRADRTHLVAVGG